MRALDEVAEAIRRAHGRRRRPAVVSGFGLEEHFDGAVAPEEWNAIREHLACPLPPLEFFQGYWFLPAGFKTIWDLVEHALDAHPELEPPTARTVAAWREAQIFAGVKIVMIEALGVDPEAVVRSARINDLAE
jgi:hypothetical protein